MKNQAHPIIVVKRRKAKSHGAAHGSWKIAYADFMTAMMAFFLVMWLISISSPKELIQIAEYFRTLSTGRDHPAISAIDFAPCVFSALR
ncbi:flagellar motor protein MotB, partial [Escherichia sp. SP-MK2]